MEEASKDRPQYKCNAMLRKATITAKKKVLDRMGWFNKFEHAM